MAKGILIFDLPKEECEFKIASTAMDWALAVQDLDNQLRLWLKHGHSFLGPEDTLEWIRKLIRETLEERNISLGMII